MVQDIKVGISVIPFQVSPMHAARGEIKVIPLTDPWAKRRFAVCFRDQASLAPAAARLVEFLAAKASGSAKEACECWAR